MSEDDLDLGFWGAVAERAERFARSNDESKKEIIGVLLRKATTEVTGGTLEDMKGGVLQKISGGIGNKNEFNA